MLSRTLLILFALMLPFPSPAEARPANLELRDGKLLRDGEWVFLKIGKPLRNFGKEREVEQLIADLPLLQEKGYNALSINCYWHHFDKTGDGVPDVSLAPLRRLIDAIHERGIFPILSIETYGVGGGFLPDPFWEKHPDAIAINGLGKPVSDDEYGTGARVPSLFSPAYLEASRTFIRHITEAVDHAKILYYETTVEPQYMGNQDLCFSIHAKAAYERWLRATRTDGPAFPEKFPVADSFVRDPAWNRFRAEYLANWINEDAAVFRSVAGDDAWIAVDYLETCGDDMMRRLGDSRIFLRNLTAADILQVNWHWHVANHAPNHCAYENVRAISEETGRDWTLTEHMTLNASDYNPAHVELMLRNTLAQGNRFGWEFVSVSPITSSYFALYNDDWSAKPLIAVVDENWEKWMKMVRDYAAIDGK